MNIRLQITPLLALCMFSFYCISFQSAKAQRLIYVDQNDSRATDEGTGTSNAPFKSINPAAQIANPGDTVLVFGGVYRERVSPLHSGKPGSPIVYMSAEGENVVIKGSDILSADWEPLPGSMGVFSCTIPEEMIQDFNPFIVKATGHKAERNLGQVFVNGEPFSETSSLDMVKTIPGTWRVENEATLYIHLIKEKSRPEDQKIELSVRNRVFAPKVRGLGYITVKGFSIEHCANQFPNSFWVRDRNGGNPQGGALSTRSGHNWVIENNTIRFANSIGLDIGMEGGYDFEGDQPAPDTTGYHLIKNNIISDNGACGIAGARSPYTHILYNRIERNNYQGWTAPEVGGIKVHWFTHGLIEGNIVKDNDAHGIWLDNGCINSRVTRNVVVNSRGTGIFTELADGPCLIDNNIVAFTRIGDGIYAHDCSGMTFANNLLYCNSHYGVYVRVVTNRGRRDGEGGRKLVGAHSISVLNNIFVDNYRGNISMPYPSDRVYNNASDYNLFINGSQWHWEGLILGRFNINMANGSLDADGNLISEDMGDYSGRKVLAKELLKALDENGVSEEGIPNLDLWIQEPYLKYNWWQWLTGFDTHSATYILGNPEIENGAVSKGTMSLSAIELYFETREPSFFTGFNCPLIEGVDKDFYGVEINAENNFPGPFQIYTRGHNKFLLNPPEKQ